MELKLKPCPFCGANVGFIVFEGDYSSNIGPSITLTCPKGCVSWSRFTQDWDWDAKRPVNVAEAATEALVAKWNTRYTPS